MPFDLRKLVKTIKSIFSATNRLPSADQTARKTEESRDGSEVPAFSSKDILAFMIAAATVLLPIALLILLAYWLVLLAMDRFWLN